MSEPIQNFDQQDKEEEERGESNLKNAFVWRISSVLLGLTGVRADKSSKATENFNL